MKTTIKKTEIVKLIQSELKLAKRITEKNNARKSLKEGRMNRHDMNDILIEYLGEEGALDAIVRAMSDDDFKDIFEYITRMHEIEY